MSPEAALESSLGSSAVVFPVKAVSFPCDVLPGSRSGCREHMLSIPCSFRQPYCASNPGLPYPVRAPLLLVPFCTSGCITRKGGKPYGYLALPLRCIYNGMIRRHIDTASSTSWRVVGRYKASPGSTGNPTLSRQLCPAVGTPHLS